MLESKSNLIDQIHLQSKEFGKSGPGICFQNNLELISELDLHGKPAGQGYSKCVRRVAMVFEVQPVFFNSGDFHPRGLDMITSLLKQSEKRGFAKSTRFEDTSSLSPHLPSS